MLLLHTFIPHDHPHEIFGTGIQAAFHGEDKKWWALLVLVSLFFALVRFIRERLNVDLKNLACKPCFYLTLGFSKIFDPIREALRRGILHPKLCD